MYVMPCTTPGSKANCLEPCKSLARQAGVNRAAHQLTGEDCVLQDSVPSAPINFVSGAVASLAATLLTQPADVIRTHMQLDLARGLANRLGPWATFQAVLRLGPAAIFAGTAPRVSLPMPVDIQAHTGALKEIEPAVQHVKPFDADNTHDELVCLVHPTGVETQPAVSPGLDDI